MVRRAISVSTLSLLLALAGTAHADIVHVPGTGRIVAAHDANTLSTHKAGEQEARFAVNVAKFLTQAPAGGSILMVEASTISSIHDYSPVVESALANAGFDITVTQQTDWTLSQLEGFDAIFIGTIFDDAYRTIDAGLLTQFVRGGRGVYVFGGMGPDRATEAGVLNNFVAPLGLSFDAAEGPGLGGYNGVYETPVASMHPIFEGVTHLRSANGLNVRPTMFEGLSESAGEANMLLSSTKGDGLYGVITGVPVPTPGAFALFGAGSVLMLRRRRA
jgi:hypothetical protein